MYFGRIKMEKLLVIYYHEVVEKGGGNAYQKIEEEKVEEQMRYLFENGYTSLFFSELGEPLPKKAVIVSFDDGFYSVYEKAAPILKKYGIKANVYLPTAYIGKEKFMTWEQVVSLTESGLFEMQAHTHAHVDVRTKDEKGILDEIEKSSEQFLLHGLKLPTAFCFPFGTFDRKSVVALKKTGAYKYLLGSYYGMIGKGVIKKGGLMARIGISNNDDMQTFIKKLNGKLNWKGPLQRVRLFLSNLKGQRVEKYDY